MGHNGPSFVPIELVEEPCLWLERLLQLDTKELCKSILSCDRPTQTLLNNEQVHAGAGRLKRSVLAAIELMYRVALRKRNRTSIFALLTGFAMHFSLPGCILAMFFPSQLHTM
jgi:hypothetical protein